MLELSNCCKDYEVWPCLLLALLDTLLQPGRSAPSSLPHLLRTNTGLGVEEVIIEYCNSVSDLY
jgi:hypothetical protein